MRILVVEDDLFSQKLMVKLMSEYGEVDLAENGNKAVILAGEAMEAKTPYDLITLDIMLPEMDGQEALVNIRKLEKKFELLSGATKIIMTTALDDSKNIFDSYRHACDGYVNKPISKVELRTVLEKANVI